LAGLYSSARAQANEPRSVWIAASVKAKRGGKNMVDGVTGAKLRDVSLFAVAALFANYAYACLIFWTLRRLDRYLGGSPLQGALYVASVFWIPLLVTFLLSRHVNALSAWPEETRDIIVVIASGAIPFLAFAIYLG
jgi:hypothetical protein